MADKRYPRGKIREDDDGGVPMAIFTSDNTVFIEFGHDVKWVGMSPNQAIEFGETILKAANDLKRKLN